jgi:precorrin-2 dehydrogenase/sirohydrochlorin ferrochelatase
MSRPSGDPHYPVFLDLVGRLCIVVGCGPVAESKVRALLECGADVAVISPQAGEDLLQMSSDGLITVEQRGYVRGDLDGAFLVMCVGQPAEVGRAIHDEAVERTCLVNVSGAPELCNYLVPSTVSRGALQMAVSTGGVAPDAARLARARLEREFGEEWADYVRLSGEVRALVLARELDDDAKRELLRRAADSGWLERLTAGEALTAEVLVAELEETGSGDGADQEEAP